MPRKKNDYTMGDYIPTPEQQEAMVWCINNHIKMYPIRAESSEPGWYIGIQIGRGIENKSPQAYEPVEIWEQMFKYYEYYYVKYREQTSSGDSGKS